MNSTKRPLIVGVNSRSASTPGRVRVALAVAQRAGAQTQMIAEAALNLPFYELANPARSSMALALVDALRRADGITVAMPSYHGSTLWT